MEKGQRPDRSKVCSWSPASRHCMHLWDQLIILQGVMFQKFDKRDKTDQYLQLLTPHNLRKEIVTETNISHQTIFQIPMVNKMNSDVREDFLFSFQGFPIGDVSCVKVMLPPPFFSEVVMSPVMFSMRMAEVWRKLSFIGSLSAQTTPS